MELRDNAASRVISEYNQRAMLAKLGYTFDSSKLSAFKAECFMVIAGEIGEASKPKKNAKKPQGRRKWR